MSAPTANASRLVSAKCRQDEQLEVRCPRDGSAPSCLVIEHTLRCVSISSECTSCADIHSLATVPLHPFECPVCNGRLLMAGASRITPTNLTLGLLCRKCNVRIRWIQNVTVVRAVVASSAELLAPE
jgi:hypothetical protein